MHMILTHVGAVSIRVSVYNGSMERVPCPPDICGTDRCPVFIAEGMCYEDVHHKVWPRRIIKRLGKVARDYRELEENKELRCRQSHNDLHASTPPPELPNVNVMREAIRRVRVDA